MIHGFESIYGNIYEVIVYRKGFFHPGILELVAMEYTIPVLILICTKRSLWFASLYEGEAGLGFAII